MGHKFDTNDTFATQEESLADKVTKGIGTKECAKFRTRIFNHHPDLSIQLATKYLQTSKNQDYIKANQDLLNLDELLIKRDLNLSWDSEQINDFCKNASIVCARFVAHYSCEQVKIHCHNFAKKYDLEINPPSKLKQSDLNRFQCERWWKKNIFVLRKRVLETVKRNLNIICSKNQTYVSDYAVRIRKVQKENSRAYLESKFIQNEQGQTYSLLDIAERSVSNPTIRRAELMTRISGFEKVADLVGDTGLFITVNTPSRMHATIKTTGKPNLKFDGTNPRQAHQYLCHVWALIRAELHRKGIHPYGFRIVEPHHDGTPHWHLLLFVNTEQTNVLSETISRYALLDSPNEKGAKKARTKIIQIDPAKGSAAGYIAKYVSKNIDGFGLDKDLEGNDATSSAHRIETWASFFGIRQFQQIGGPSVTVWRELRRLRQKTDEEIEPYRQAADAGDWAAYTLLMGGPIGKRADRSLQTWHKKREVIDFETGEIKDSPLTYYGDETPDILIGIKSKLSGRHVSTRKHIWQVLDSQLYENTDNYSHYQSHAPPNHKI